MNLQTLDFEAARSRRERELEDARQRGWLDARRYYLMEHESDFKRGFWLGVGCGLLLATFVAAIVRAL